MKSYSVSTRHDFALFSNSDSSIFNNILKSLYYVLGLLQNITYNCVLFQENLMNLQTNFFAGFVTSVYISRHFFPIHGHVYQITHDRLPENITELTRRDVLSLNVVDGKTHPSCVSVDFLSLRRTGNALWFH